MLDSTNIHEHRIHLPITKNRRRSDLPILQRHHEILVTVRGLHPRRVFPSPKGREERLTSPPRIMWTPHAHRRIFTTVAREAGDFGRTSEPH